MARDGASHRACTERCRPRAGGKTLLANFGAIGRPGTHELPTVTNEAAGPFWTDKIRLECALNFRFPVARARARSLLGRELPHLDPALQARYQRQQEHRHQQRTDREGAASQNASDYLENRGWEEQDRGRDR
jgi:hypothetical protein